MASNFTLAVCKRGDVLSSNVGDPVGRGEYPHGKAFGPLGVPLSTKPLPDFCPQCGLPVMTVCEHCNSPIPRPDYLRKQPTPSFCTKCGEPFPWATREERIRRIRSFLDAEQGLSPADRLVLIEQIDILAEPEEREPLAKRKRAAERLQKLAPAAWTSAQPILTTLLSDELQQALHMR